MKKYLLFPPSFITFVRFAYLRSTIRAATTIFFRAVSTFTGQNFHVKTSFFIPVLQIHQAIEVTGNIFRAAGTHSAINSGNNAFLPVRKHAVIWKCMPVSGKWLAPGALGAGGYPLFKTLALTTSLIE